MPGFVIYHLKHHTTSAPTDFIKVCRYIPIGLNKGNDFNSLIFVTLEGNAFKVNWYTFRGSNSAICIVDFCCCPSHWGSSFKGVRANSFLRELTHLLEGLLCP